MSVDGVDSSDDRPTPALALALRALGVHQWAGYLATVEAHAVNLEAAWTREQFEAARLCGGDPVAFCSGWDDPRELRRLARTWRLRLCLDLEDAIRGDGPWVPDFLNLSGAGLYGLLAVHRHPAPFHVAALYPSSGCTGATWPTASPPPGPHGWQCRGSHRLLGLTVDSARYDDWFGTRQEVNDMPFTVTGPDGNGYLVSGSLVVPVPHAEDTPGFDDTATLATAGVLEIPGLSQQFVDSLAAAAAALVPTP